jgi:hypothetical protein
MKQDCHLEVTNVEVLADVHVLRTAENYAVYFKMISVILPVDIVTCTPIARQRFGTQVPAKSDSWYTPLLVYATIDAIYAKQG